MIARLLPVPLTPPTIPARSPGTVPQAVIAPQQVIAPQPAETQVSAMLGGLWASLSHAVASFWPYVQEAFRLMAANVKALATSPR